MRAGYRPPFVAEIHGFVAARGLELVSFGKERKDDVAQQFLARFTGTEGVLFVGRAQEKALVWRTQRRYNQAGEPYAWLVRSTAFISYFYFYCFDEDFGPFFIKVSTYFPYAAKLCLNGNECAKRQAARPASYREKRTAGRVLRRFHASAANVAFFTDDSST